MPWGKHSEDVERSASVGPAWGILSQDQTLGAKYLGGGKSEFAVWAPGARGMDVRVVSPAERMVRMERGLRGYWSATGRDSLDAAGFGVLTPGPRSFAAYSR